MINTVPLVLSDDKQNEIVGYLLEKFRLTVQARSNQVDDRYKRWHDNYSGKPKEEVRTTPFAGASNFIPQLIRMHTDILSARICGLCFATKPFWKVRYFLKDLEHDSIETLSEWLEYISFNDIELFEPIDSTIFQTAKCGTVVLKAPWVDQSFASMNGKGEAVLNNHEGIKLYTIPFDDFYPYPITARRLNEVQIKFHVLRFSKEEVQWRKANGIWNTEAADNLLLSPESEDSGTKRESEATEAGIELTEDVSRPFNVVETWLEYPLDGRVNYRLVYTFNPKSSGKLALLRSIYNYYSRGIDPFIDFRFMPRDDLFYGYSVPEVLEQAQEEQAQIHNARRDSNTITNVPGWKKKMYGNVPNPTQSWYPGVVFEVDAMDDLEPLQFPGNYNSMIDEEMLILQLSERYSGINTPMQGLGAGTMEGKRGIYNSQGTLAMLAEGNKRLDIFLKRLRLPFHRVGNIIFQSHKEFRPDGPEIEAFGADRSQRLKKLFAITEPFNFRGLFFDIGATDAGANRELDRQNLLLMANTMAAYYRQVVESSTMLAQLPSNHPLQNILLSVLDGARDLANRLLFAFEIGDRERVLPDVREVLQGGVGRPGLANPPGVPGAEGALGLEDLSNLSSRLNALTGGGFPQTGRGGTFQ
jgi:hypothetical protein